MSLLFTPGTIGTVTIRNRFVCAATYEGMADESGAVTEELMNLYSRLARGGAGLVLSSFMYVHPRGRALRRQMGIHGDDLVPGGLSEKNPWER